MIFAGENGDLMDDVFDHISATKLTDASDEDFKPAGLPFDFSKDCFVFSVVVFGLV